MTTVNNSNVLMVDPMSISAADISEMDLETALLAVQMNRATQLEDQLKTQMTAVQAKNDQMALLTTLQNNLNAVMNGLPSNMTDTTILGDNLDNQVGLEETVNDSMQAAQVQLFKTSDGEYRIGLLSSGDSYEGGINRNVTKGELDLALNDIQSMLTNLSNTQQTDMLTLQSTTNKRNEAYDTMTNFLKKLQDSKSGIVSNMRS